MQQIYIGRQAIFDQNTTLFAYEILYRDIHNTNHISSHRYASASVLSNVLNKFGTHLILGDKKGFVKIDEKFLMSDLIFLIPSDFFIFSIFSDVEMNEKVVERFEQLHKKSYVLAINDISLNEKSVEKYVNVFQYIDYVKINFNEADTYNEKEVCSLLKSHNIRIIAVKIENENIYTHAQKYGCDFYQGYYFEKPKIFETFKQDPARMDILKLYNLLMQDVNIDEITKEFEKNPEVIVQLLQFVNSGSFEFTSRISSIHHILLLVGRVRIAQWLMLMIYSKSVSSDTEHSPIMQKVKNRTDLIKIVLKTIAPDARSNMLGTAYFMGILSFSEELLGMGLETILQRMYISELLSEALLYKKGKLGEVLKFVIAIENSDIRDIEEFEKLYNISDNVLKKFLSAMDNAILP